MSLAYIRSVFDIPAWRGMRVRYCAPGKQHLGWEGVVTSAKGGRLFVRRDGEREPRICHPTRHLTYLGDGA